MIPRLMHVFSGAAGEYTNVTPDYTDSESSGVVLSHVKLDANGHMTKHSTNSCEIYGLPAIPASYVRHYIAHGQWDWSVTSHDYSQGLAWQPNYAAGNSQWWCGVRDIPTNHQSEIYYWNGTTVEHNIFDTGLNVTVGTPPHRLTVHVVEQDDYLFSHAFVYGDQDSEITKSFGTLRAYMLNRYNKAVTDCRLWLGAGTDYGYANCHSIRIIDVPELT